jgi:hypothetical protein
VLFVVAVGFLIVLIGWRILKTLRYFPPDQRAKALPVVLKIWYRALIGADRRQVEPNDPTWESLAPPAEPIFVDHWSTFGDTPDFVTQRQQLTQEGGYAQLRDVDVDGAALIMKTRHNDTGYELWLETRQGERIDVIPSGVHLSGDLLDASIDHGAVALLRDNPAGRCVELWRWDRDGGARLVHSLDYPAKLGFGGAHGWVLLLGDVIVATFLPGGTGTIVAHHPQHGIAHLSSTSFGTLHRDLVAEALGKRRAAVNMHVPSEPTGVVTELDLDVWPPQLTPLRRGMLPGASTQLGRVLGFTPGTKLLEVPGRPGIAFSAGVVTDPVGDDRLIAFPLAAMPNTGPKVMGTEAFVVDVRSRRRTLVTGRARGKMFMRGNFIAWNEAAPYRSSERTPPFVGSTSWVAELVKGEEGPR